MANKQYIELTEKTSLNGTEVVPMQEVAGGAGSTKHFTLTTLKGWLKTAFDSVYAAVSHGHAASDVSDFDTEVGNHTDVAANTSARHSHSNKSTLDLITEAFTTALKAKLDFIAITQAVDLDDIESRVNALDAAVVLKGVWDASVGTFPGGGSAQAGWSYIVSVSGTVDGVEFVADDRIIAIVDNASTTTYANNWHKADYTDRVNTVNSQTGTVVLDHTDVGAEQADADILKADTPDILTTGFATTPSNAGTKSSGTFTPDEADGNFQYAVNGGAHTLAPPTNNSNLVIQYTNNASAGAITTSGFTIVTGDSLTITDGDDFLMYITKCNGFSHLNVVALQ